MRVQSLDNKASCYHSNMRLNNKPQNFHPSFKSLISQKQINEIIKNTKNPQNIRKYLDSIESYNAFIRGLDRISFNQITDQLYQKYGIETDLKGNKVIAGANALVCNIFQKLGLIKPPALYMRSFPNSQQFSRTYAVTSVHKQMTDFDIAMKERYPLRSVIYNSNIDWDKLQLMAISEKESGHSSTGHFLHVFLHEFFHNVHADNLYKRFGSEARGSDVFAYLQRKYSKQANIELVKKETGRYGSTNPAETFADEMSERIADSLNPRTLLPDKNPFAFMEFEGRIDFNQMIDDIWQGKKRKY